jgi:predicted RNA-binding protein with PUA-like domain
MPKTTIDTLNKRHLQIRKFRNYWLIKAEPLSRIVKGTDVKFSITDLQVLTTTQWDGVRNYEARNNLRLMRIGDLCLFYHSNCKIPGIAGIAQIVKEAVIDSTAFDSKHPYYDPKSVIEQPKWYAPTVKFIRSFKNLIALNQLQSYKDSPELNQMFLLKRPRLSVQPVKVEQYQFILKLDKELELQFDIQNCVDNKC